MKQNPKISLEKLDSGLERGIEAMDELRVVELAEEFRSVSALRSTHGNEAERLKAKYGDDYPMAIAMEARFESDGEQLEIIDVMHATAATPAPDPCEGWVVDGFVRSFEGDAVSGVTVAGYDRKECWYEELGYGCSDERGYFSIVVDSLGKNPPRPVFLRASISGTLVSPPDIRLTPVAKTATRVDIVIDTENIDRDCKSPDGGDGGGTRPPDSDVVISVNSGFDDWLVTGKITDTKGEGVADLKVHVYEKDLVKDDALGVARTDSDGVYRLTFTKEQFSDFAEKYPELYLVIEDLEGNCLFDGNREVKDKRGRIELIDIELKGGESSDKK